MGTDTNQQKKDVFSPVSDAHLCSSFFRKLSSQTDRGSGSYFTCQRAHVSAHFASNSPRFCSRLAACCTDQGHCTLHEATCLGAVVSPTTQFLRAPYQSPSEFLFTFLPVINEKKDPLNGNSEIQTQETDAVFLLQRFVS